MRLLGISFSVIFAVSFFVPTSAVENAKVNEIRELLKDSVDYKNWCAKCREDGTKMDVDLYEKLCHMFDAEMMAYLGQADVGLTSSQFFRVFMDKDFCLNVTVPMSSIAANSSHYPRTYMTVLSDLPWWNETQYYKPKISQRDGQGICPLYWIIPVVVVGSVIVISGISYVRYRGTRSTANIHIPTTGAQKQAEAGTVFESIDKL